MCLIADLLISGLGHHCLFVGICLQWVLIFHFTPSISNFELDVDKDILFHCFIAGLSLVL